MSPDGHGDPVSIAKIPGFSVASWINYCLQITDIYAAAFPHNRLEFDFSYLYTSFDKLEGSGAREAADHFIAQLIARNILIAQNGLSSDYNADKPPHQRAFLYLMEARRQGKAVSLEAQNPMWSPAMQDVSAIAGTVREIAPERLDFFGSDAGALNFMQNGANPSNATTVESLSHHGSVEKIGQLDQQLLQLIGY